jgi:hypothetical protein
MTDPYSDLGGLPGVPLPEPKPISRRPQYAGCEHTDDPAGWLMDEAGNITGRCPCWYEQTGESPEDVRGN